MRVIFSDWPTHVAAQHGDANDSHSHVAAQHPDANANRSHLDGAVHNGLAVAVLVINRLVINRLVIKLLAQIKISCIIVFVVTNEGNKMKTFHVYYRLGARKGMITLQAMSHKDAEAKVKLWYNDAFVLAAVGERGSEE